MLDRAKAHLTRYEVDNKTSVESILQILRLRRSTAHVEIVVTGGGVRAITVTERTALEKAT